MTVNDAAEKVATNPVLGALARLAMFLTPILVSIALFILGNYLSAQASAMEALSNRISLTETMASALDKRVSILEGSIERGRLDRIAFQERTETTLEKLMEQMTQDRILAAQVKTDVSYLRDWVAEQKRAAKQ